MEPIPGIGVMAEEYREDFLDLNCTSDGAWKVGIEGVQRILTPLDRKVEFICFKDKTLTLVKSGMGHPAIYPLPEGRFEPPAKAVLMDLDGTSVVSEEFWIWIIEQSTARLLGNPQFTLEEADLPHVSGHSVSEHLRYCIDKYCPGKTVEEGRKYYFDITHFELNEILEGRGKQNAFKPAPGLKEFLLELKGHGVKIGLVTSGLYEKAWPEIVSAFRTMGLGNPLEFYDAIISAGFSIKKGQVGTLGELEAKPHPWLYAEIARVGLGIEPSLRHRTIGLEDSSAGVVSIRLAGFGAIGIGGGNITQSGVRPLLFAECASLAEALPTILGH
ncbi:MAG TPA: HAD hydrolase-like protein [bacterium]|nr:HAD hydrolase-like protein [bacterium]HQL61407.1 HAD hydrolase-like protein [bacterium]